MKRATKGPLVAAMQQIADWLKKLGMSEYTERFVENRIDLSVLPDLTHRHLEKLGVTLGDRLKKGNSGAFRHHRNSGSTRRRCGTSHATWRRTPAAHCHVLRSGWLDGAAG
jgi:hypothetical protein